LGFFPTKYFDTSLFLVINLYFIVMQPQCNFCLSETYWGICLTWSIFEHIKWIFENIFHFFYCACIMTSYLFCKLWTCLKVI
jgi:hypothetical protein